MAPISSPKIILRNEVNEEKFPKKYHKVLYSQANIGWNQLFMGRISQEWLQLYKNIYEKPVGCTKSPHYYDGFVWGETLLKSFFVK